MYPPHELPCALTAAAGVALALAACAPATPSQSKALEPEVANLTPLASQLFTGHDQAGAYYSLDAKATFAIDAPGKLRLLDLRSSEPVPGAADMQGETMSVDRVQALWRGGEPAHDIVSLHGRVRARRHACRGLFPGRQHRHQVAVGAQRWRDDLHRNA
ncbi:hypothetical protein [Paraburkholderia bannensis]|uniref:hypothetical protein n=1 Tax=Paraburkholderia bannensis TaxID=765414 RepID=UPI002ABDD113|nr:hypothetical protein [Paraburkholderia bannensis]